MSAVGRMVKRFIIAPRVRKLSWNQLLAGAGASRERFLARVADETDLSASIAARGAMSVRDTLAHLAAANRGIAERLEGLRQGRALPAAAGDIFPGSEGMTLEEARAAEAESFRRLASAAARPIDSGQRAAHSFFGPMSAPEWVAVVSVHYEYHIRRVDRVKQSEEYRRALGASW